MTLKIDDLRKFADMLLLHLKEQGIDEVPIDADYYWNIPSDELYEPRKTPVELDIGQLSEDLNRLRKILIKEDEPIGYALVWLSSLLRYVGERNVS